MEMIFCPNCGKLTGYRRALGFGTLFAVFLTAGVWLLAIPFYPKRCITCGLTKAASLPWYRVWLLPAIVVLAGGIVATLVVIHFDGTRASPIELLGFKQGTKEAGVHASAIAFRLKDCEDKGDDFRYCNYLRETDEALTLIFWRDELETVEYEAGIKRYRSLFKELSSRYGRPRQSDEFPHGGNWESYTGGAMLSLVERADQSGGVATLGFEGGKLDEYMKSTFPIPQTPPEVSSQALPEIRMAEWRLFGEKTTEIENLGVVSETMQGYACCNDALPGSLLPGSLCGVDGGPIDRPGRWGPC